MAKNRPNVKDIVFDHLQGLWDMDELNKLDFMDVHHLVKRDRPESKFNPQHLALYKHQFLKGVRNGDKRRESVDQGTKDRDVEKAPGHSQKKS